MTSNKTWWAPIWRGLVVDPQAKHCRRMKNAVWLFLYVILHANRATGTLKRKTETIAADMGVGAKRVQRWLKILRDNGYIDTETTGRCLLIVIKRWKNQTANPNAATQHGHVRPASPDKDEDAPDEHSLIKLLDLGHGSHAVDLPNDISIKKNDDEIVGRAKSIDSLSLSADQRQIAAELTETLGDPEGIAFYMSLAQRHSAQTLQCALTHVMEFPEGKIKKSRAALFNHLIQQ